jgi:hypothetical protein
MLLSWQAVSSSTTRRLHLSSIGPRGWPSRTGLSSKRQQHRLVVPGCGNTSRTHAGTSACSCTYSALRSFSRSSLHQIVESKISPRWLLLSLRCALDAKSSVLIRHHVILVFGIDRLQVRRDVDVFRRKLRRRWVRKRLEEVGMVRVVHVKVRRHGIACLALVSLFLSWTDY